MKYELGGGYRLVTVQTLKVVAFCFVGDHEECDRWLDSHSGLTLGRGSTETGSRSSRARRSRFRFDVLPLRELRPCSSVWSAGVLTSYWTVSREERSWSSEDLDRW